MTDVHVVFGSNLLAKRYSQNMAVRPSKVVLATEPLEVYKITPKDTVYVVRYTKDVWEPPSHPCAARVRETEERLKKLKKDGAEIVDRHFG